MTGTAGARATPDKKAAAGLLAAGVALLIAAMPIEAAAIDSVPLPRLRADRAATVSRLADPNAAIARQPLMPQISADSRFTPSQQIALARINAYFNSFRTMQGEFIQIGPRGEQSEGVFFLSRPGKIRFHFQPPAKLDIISDGSSVAIKDGRTNTQDLYPLSKTPLRYLLADRINLTSEQLVDSVREEPDLIALIIVERSAVVDGKLTLIFDRKTYQLRQWIVTDAQGLDTSVAIYNVTTGKRPDPGLFRINISATPGN